MPIIYNSSIFGQPPQALPSDEKNQEWKMANMDWLEQLLKAQLPEKQRRLIKNYNVMQGVIDVEDYVNQDVNQYREMFDVIGEAIEKDVLAENETVIDDLKFYPIIPIVVNVLVGELLKKFDHIKVKAVDEYSINEYHEFKKKLVLQAIQQKAQQQILQSLQSQGITQDSPDFQEQVQQGMQQAMSLPEIEEFMKNTYKSNHEEWANRILEQANFKYKLPDKEVELFKHQLASDEGYAEVRIDDNDLDVILWNPYDTLVMKPKHVKYVSEADLVSRQYWTSIHDVVSKYRDKIDAALIEKYNAPLGVVPTFSDRRLSPDDNRSLMHQERKLVAFKYMIGGMELSQSSKVLMTEAYWMSRRRMARLEAVYGGKKIGKIVDDTFKVTIEPEYNDEGELIAGEVLHYFYAPQVWKGTKVNFSYGSVPHSIIDENKYLDKTIFGKNPESKDSDVERGYVYIDVQPVEYQFTDSINPFKPRIPIAGCDGFEPTMNVGKLAFIDKTKPYQVGFNGCMNEIDLFMKTEIGIFFAIDQKTIPKNSLDGSWGKYNWLKYMLTAKETGLGVHDYSQANTEGGQMLPQPMIVNLLKTPQFQSRMELANFFEAGLLKVVGITPQRMGTINSQETATGINQAINNSYSQTELYFKNHTGLMKELKEIILDAEKYIESKKPISRVQHLNSDVQNMIFELDTEDLLLRRFNIWLTSNSDTQRVLEQLRQLAIQNNTAGASMLDLAVIIESNNTKDIKDKLAESMRNLEKKEQVQREHEQQMLQQKLEAEAAEKDKERAFQADQNERTRLSRMYEAEVKATGMARNNDLNTNAVNDALEVERFNLDTNKHYSDILDRQQDRGAKSRDSALKKQSEDRKIAVKEKEIASKERMKQMEIAADLRNQQNDKEVAEINLKGRNKKK